MLPSASTPHDNFSYERDTFFVTVGGHNVHRRATIFEIQELLHPPSSSTAQKDQVGHWYEAQCVHYGLPPSKTKSVAKTRLLDALNSKALDVPPALRQLEEKLRKQWLKAEKEKAKLVEKPSRKRKASPPADAPMRKKPAAEKKDKALPAAAVKPKPATKKKAEAAPAQPAKRARQTASSTRGGSTRGGRAGTQGDRASFNLQASQQPTAASTTDPRPPRQKQTARRSRPWYPGAGRGATANEINEDDDEDDEEDEEDAPPPYEAIPSPAPSSNSILGLINGSYSLACPSLQDEWSEYETHEFTLTLALQGTVLWGGYDLGMFSGVLRLLRRPYAASPTARHALSWRGVEHGEGEMSDGEGWIKFLGGGRVQGELTGLYGDRNEFEGVRVSADTARGAQSLSYEWDSYDAAAYETARVRRWG